MLHGQTGDGKSARVKQIAPNTKIIYLASADSRKWEMASKVLNKTGKPDMLRTLIGTELTYDFKNFITQKVITLEDVLNDNYDNIEMNI